MYYKEKRHVRICNRYQHITKTYNMYKKPSDRFKEALSPTKKSYHDLFYALDDVTMQIKKGEMIGFVGENGSAENQPC